MNPQIIQLFRFVTVMGMQDQAGLASRVLSKKRLLSGPRTHCAARPILFLNCVALRIGSAFTTMSPLRPAELSENFR